MGHYLEYAYTLDLAMKLKVPLILLLLASILWYCKTSQPPAAQTQTAEEKNVRTDAVAVVSAQEALKYMTIEDGFEVQLVAAEPLVEAPVALSFDPKGRIWVVEMPGYMNDTLGSNEEAPTGKIVILEDTNQDGQADRKKVFLDSLILPRAICFIENGILVAEPPYLWHYEIKNDKPGKKTLVDSAYAKGGNVEHQANGLVRALDNWIYNAKSDKRYRKVGEKWLIEKTHYRGQWGIAQDNTGRLYYNHNSQNVIADYYLPGFGAGNANQRNDVAGFNTNITTDNRVYPLHATPGVNRGYMKETLDDSLRLRSFTAACGPVVYRGEQFPAAYASNVFVAEPSANLVKRNLVQEQGNVLMAKQAYQKREFLASTDERFRPVSLNNGPDGALYLIDMYRGIIQHKTYLTTYLKGQIAKRQLTQPLNCGRIYRIVSKQKPYTAAQRPLPQQPEQLVALLESPNGWLRDYAQQALIDGKYTTMVPRLRQLLTEGSQELARVHALWTLEGLGALSTQDVLLCLRDSSWPIRRQGLGVIPSQLSASNWQLYAVELEKRTNDTLAYPYLAFLSGSLRRFNATAADALAEKILQKRPRDRYLAAAVVSTLANQEAEFQNRLRASLPDSNLAVYRSLKVALKNAASTRTNRDPALLARQYPKGANLFNTICQTCHGKDGNGVASLAPPLNKSEWVTGRKDHLISIVLYGLTGPVSVNNHLYTAPEINADMPGIGYDPSLSSGDVAELLSFIRKSWQNNAEGVTTGEVDQVRKSLVKREKAFTIKELQGQQ